MCFVPRPGPHPSLYEGIPGGAPVRVRAQARAPPPPFSPGGVVTGDWAPGKSEGAAPARICGDLAGGKDGAQKRDKEEVAVVTAEGICGDLAGGQKEEVAVVTAERICGDLAGGTKKRRWRGVTSC